MTLHESNFQHDDGDNMSKSDCKKFKTHLTPDMILPRSFLAFVAELQFCPFSLAITVKSENKVTLIFSRASQFGNSD